MTSSNKRHGSKLEFALVLIFTAVAIFFTSIVFDIDMTDPYDEGLHFLNYAMFKAGKIPYIDYFPIFPPIWTYSNIVLEMVFGEFLLVQRLWFIAQGVFLAFVCFLCLRKFVHSRAIAMITTLMVIAYGLDAYWVARWSGARLAVYIIFLMLINRYFETERRNRVWLFSIGLLAGLSNLYAFDVGIHITLASISIICSAMLIRSSFNTGNLKNLMIPIAGFLLPTGAWAVYLAMKGALVNYASIYYYTYMFQLMPISVKALSGGALTPRDPNFALLLVFVILLCIPLGYLIIYRGLIKRDLTGKDLIPVAAINLTLLSSISTVRAVGGGPQYTMFTFIPMVLWGGWLISLVREKFFADKTAVTALVMAIFAAVPFPYYKDNLTVKYMMATNSYSLMSRMLSSDKGLDAAKSGLGTLGGLYGEKKFDGICIYIREHTAPGESVLAFPMFVEILPALAERPHATRFPIPLLLAGSPELQKEYIEDVEREQPRYLFFHEDVRFGNVPLEPYFKPVYDYIYENYRPAVDAPYNEKYQIWVRKYL
ncbi:MAG: hypothetical protein HYV24_11670 [Deltaproteobacteria bacterium]|nr:hypothetical protein [Deltaproteobacteria bacterium]